MYLAGQSRNPGLVAQMQAMCVAAYVIKHTNGVVGFFGASSMERLPTETAIAATVARFKAIPM